jgi:probable HAF family extracellular repeat protein
VTDPGADLGTLGGTSSIGLGINASGQVTGWSQLAPLGNSPAHAFRTTATGRVSDPGTDLGTLGGSNSEGRGINASGQVTGTSFVSGFTAQHAFRTTPTGRVSDPGTDLGTLGGTNSFGNSINDAGQVAGSSEIVVGSAVQHAFRTTATGRVSDPGADLGTLGGVGNSHAYGINALGMVVGASDTLTGMHAFVFDTQMRDLNFLIPSGSGWFLVNALGINDFGQITGAGTINGETHAYILTPVPEPSSVALAGAALAAGVVGVRALRRLNMLKAVLSCGIPCAAAAWPAAASAQVLYSIRDLGLGYGNAVNAAGQVTGISNTTWHAFRTAPGGAISDPGADLGILPPLENAYDVRSQGIGINAAGQVTGGQDDFVVNEKGQHLHFVRAFRTTSTGGLDTFGADLGTLGATNYSIGNGINASGQVTGSSAGHAYRTTAKGRISDPGTDLGTLGGGFGYSEGLGINTSGQVTGVATPAGSNSTLHAFRTTATGRISDPGTDLGTLGGASSTGKAINDAGQVTGSSEISIGSSMRHAFRTTATGRVSDPGADLGTLDGVGRSFGYGINALGVVVGSSDANVGPHAFVFDTLMRDLNNLIPPESGWTLVAATGINDFGQITGYGLRFGDTHAFLLTPAPEPTSLALTSAALLIVGIGSKKSLKRG